MTISLILFPGLIYGLDKYVEPILITFINIIIYTYMSTKFERNIVLFGVINVGQFLSDGSSIITFNTLPDYAKVVIIGGGFTGLQMALELHENNITDILVLDAGDITDGKHLNLVYGDEQAEKMWLYPELDSSFWRPWQSNTPPHYEAWAGLRRRLGGRSLYWQGITIPIEESVLSDPIWPDDIVHDLVVSWKNGPSLYKLLQQDIAKWRQIPETYESLTKRTKALFDAIGYKETIVAPVMVRHHYGKNREIRVSAYSPLEAWLNPEPTNVKTLPSVACQVDAVGIILHGIQAKGVVVQNRANGEEKQVFCEYLILAAGTFENSRLAIQALSELHGRDITLYGLNDHINQGFIAKVPLNKIPQKLIPNIQPGTLFVIKGDSSTKSNTFIYFTIEDNEYLGLHIWAMGEQIPNTDSRVICHRNTKWPWTTVVTANLADEDKVVISRQQEELNKLWIKICNFTKAESPPELEFADFGDPKGFLSTVLPRLEGLMSYKPLTWSGPLGTGEHEAGTLAYNRIIKNNNEFIDINNLFAIGTCTFPRTGAATPSLTNMALIRRLADILGQRIIAIN